MEIEGQRIDTPFDSPFAYDPDWRHEIAKQVVDHDLSHYELDYDPYIAWQINFLRAVRDGQLAKYEALLSREDASISERKAIILCHTLHDSVGRDCRKAKADALLLCPELPLTQIAAYMGRDISPLVMQIYERLHFNIRDDEGAVLEAPWAREYFATRGQDHIDRQDSSAYWKVLAFEGGHRLLFSHWGWNVLPTGESGTEQHMALVRGAFVQLEQRLRFGDLGNRDLVQLYGYLQTGTEELRERGVFSGFGRLRDAGGLAFMVELLREAAPVPIPPDQQRLLEKAPAVEQKLDIVKTSTGRGQAGSESMQQVGAQLEAVQAI